MDAPASARLSGGNITGITVEFAGYAEALREEYKAIFFYYTISSVDSFYVQTSK